MRLFVKSFSFVLAVLLLFMSALGAQASAAPVYETSSRVAVAKAKTIEMKSLRTQASADREVSPMAVADAYKVCVNGTCIWVEKTKYCGSGAACGQRSLASWPGGYCAPSTGCATINGRNYKVLVQPTYTNEESVRIGKCAGSIGFSVLEFMTKGFSRLALSGAAFSAWAC